MEVTITCCQCLNGSHMFHVLYVENSVEVHTLGGFCLTDCLYCSLVYCLCWYLVHSLCWYLVYCLYCMLSCSLPVLVSYALVYSLCWYLPVLLSCSLPVLVSCSLPMLVLMQIECINDGIGMVYSGMGPDFRLVTDTSLLLLLLLIPLSVVSCHYPSLV